MFWICSNWILEKFSIINSVLVLPNLEFDSFPGSSLPNLVNHWSLLLNLGSACSLKPYSQYSQAAPQSILTTQELSPDLLSCYFHSLCSTTQFFMCIFKLKRLGAEQSRSCLCTNTRERIWMQNKEHRNLCSPLHWVPCCTHSALLHTKYKIQSLKYSAWVIIHLLFTPRNLLSAHLCYSYYAYLLC